MHYIASFLQGVGEGSVQILKVPDHGEYKCLQDFCNYITSNLVNILSVEFIAQYFPSIIYVSYVIADYYILVKFI